MGRTSYRQSVSSSTRTFQTAPPAAAVAKTKAIRPLPLLTKLPKLPRLPVKISAQRLPWMIVAGLTMISIFLLAQYRQAQSKLRSPQGSTSNVLLVNDTLAKLAKLVVVPTNETPTVVSVANLDKLKGQEFFAHAKIGDKVIVYSKAKEAILYRPSTNQIVIIAPISSQP